MFDKNTIRDAVGRRFFSVTFVKKDNSLRKMVCILPSADHFFSGGELRGNSERLLSVVDVNLLRAGEDPKKAWRSINLDTIVEFNFMGRNWVN